MDAQSVEGSWMTERHERKLIICISRQMETIFWRVAQALDAVSVANTEGREKRLRFPFYVNASSEIATATELNLVLESD